MPRKIQRHNDTCPICRNEGREPGITELAAFVCQSHQNEMIVTVCPECGRGIFKYKRQRAAVRCTECERKAHKLDKAR